MHDAVVYFAYGSNLHVPQMESRCPDCAVLQPAVLMDWRLAFRGHSTRWGGGSATIEAAPGAQVAGLLYRLSRADVRKLDGFEGVPKVYEHLDIAVAARDGTRHVAYTYRRREGRPAAPSLLYFHQIWGGYLAFGLQQHLLQAAVQEALAAAPASAD